MAKHHQPSVSTDLVRLLLKYAGENDLPSLSILDNLGVSGETLTEPGARIPVEEFDALWHTIVTQSRDPNFGLHFGTVLRTPPEGSILFSVMMNCRTLGDAMAKLSRYHAVITEFVRLHLIQHDTTTSLTLETFIPGVTLNRHYVDAIIAGQVLTMQHLTANKVHIVEVRFSYPPPQNTSEYDRIFRCPLMFNQPCHELVLRSGDLNLPTFLANPALLERLEAIAQEILIQVDTQAIWSNRAGHLMRQALLRGEKPSLDGVASELAISVRHLQNKLKDEGTTYRDLLEQLRQKTAVWHLQNPDTSLCDIAFLLGFSDQSAFTHAFKRWTGESPSDFRRSQLGKNS